MSQTKTQLVTSVASGFNVTGVVTATKFDGALATNATGTNLTLSGDLTVQGSQTIINSDTLDVKDKTVGIASTSTPTSATQDGSGIEIYGPSNVTIKYEDQKGAIGINTGLTVSGVVTATSFSGAGSGLTGIDKITEGDTTVEVVDTGSDGHFKVTTQGNERARIDNGGRLLVGQTAGYNLYSNGLLQVSSTGGTASISVNRFSNNSSSPYINLGKSRGALGVFTVVQENDRLGQINFTGADGTDLASPAAGIAGYVDGTPGGNDMPGRLVFSTASDNSIAETERLRITRDGGFQFTNAALTERVKITAGKLSDNQNINLDNGMVHYFTTQETTTSTPNITPSAGISTIMSAGDTMVVTIITTAAAGAYSAQLSIEGVGVTENWIGGEAPAAGGASGVDIYSYTIIKTGAGTTDFTVIGNLSKTSA